VRVVGATKRSLLELVREGKFREDLYYRINAISIELPPLRERREDIPALAEHFVRTFGQARGTLPEILPETMNALLAHDWPGNVRELQHAIEHAVTFCRKEPMSPQHLAPHLRPTAAPKLLSLHLDGHDQVSFHEVVESCERGLVEWALARTAGNQVRAAELLHMSRTTFRARLAAFHLGEGADDEPPA
jgi:DNA-binding NtrC family response regulator